MIYDIKLQNISRPKISWCSIKHEIIPFRQLIQEHYRELAARKILSKNMNRYGI